MNKETLGSLKRIIEEVKEKRSATCLMKDCIINDIIGGNDIDLVEKWLKENDECEHFTGKDKNAVCVKCVKYPLI